MKPGWKFKSGLLLALCVNLAYADDATDDRVAKLQKMLEEQQWQMKAMADELKALQGARGKAEGQPVFASFKDGVKFEDGSGNWQLAINGRVQADYRNFDPDVDGADTFSLRRARLGGTMTFYKDYVARIEGEYSAGSTTLTYGYFDINKFKQAKLRIGQFKPFYGLERSMSTNFTDFQERSMGDSLLGSTYDRGVMIYGSPLTGVNYSVAYLNGTGTTDENNASNDSKDLTVRLTGNIAEMAEWKDAVVHIGGWWANGDQGSRRQASYIPTVQSEGRGVQFFSTTCAATPCGAATSNAFKDNVERTRGGAELALAYGPVKLQSEYIRTSFDAPTYNRDLEAWYANLMWNVTGEPFAAMYKEGVFGRLKPMNNFGGSGWGALQLGVRYSRFDGSDFKTTNTAGTGVLVKTTTAPSNTTTDAVLWATNEADAWTLGANWILNPNTRVMLNWVHTTFDTPIKVRVNNQDSTFDNEDAVTLRAQFDF